jgi:periplasmic protein TonB
VTPPFLSHRRETIRWFLSATAVVAIHAGVLGALLKENDLVAEGEAAAAMVVEFAEMPVAAANLPAMLPPGPEQIEAKATPEPIKEPDQETEEKVTPDMAKQVQPKVERAPNPEVAVDEQQPKKEVEKVTEKPSQAPAPITSAPQAIAEKVALVSAAPQQGVPNRSTSTALPRWTGKISVMLERNKRYPEAARANRDHGVVTISFSIDREGHLIDGEIEQSSGYSTLDQEALAILRRAQPFPPVPADVSGPRVRLTVPIRFDIR